MRPLFFILIAVLLMSCFGKPSIPKKGSGYKGSDTTAVVLKKNKYPVNAKKGDTTNTTLVQPEQELADTVKAPVVSPISKFDLYSEDGVEYIKMAAPVFLEQIDNYITVWEQNQVVNSHNLYEIKHQKATTFGGRPCIEVETLHAPNSYLPPNKAERIKFIFIKDDAGKIVFMRINGDSFASQLPNGVIPSATYVTPEKERHQSTRQVRVRPDWSISEVCGGVIFPNVILTREEFNRLNPRYRYTDNLLRNTFITIPN